ncbi:MAG: 16S rRNA (adenine(1518)-N(6)/adenine(1519)-N(6))-dimethyltransferase RsmA [Christensenellales bacterium]
MNSRKETVLLLNHYKLQANKSFGQNFLIDDDVIDGIIESANISKKDLVIEIGPGLGTLTSKLLENANKVIAVEIDNKMVEVISDRFRMYNNLQIINEDILKIDLNAIIENEKQEDGKVKIVANLPYYISTPIIMKLLEERLNIDEIVVMVQKEVADRLTAKPGTKLSGAITYAVDYYAEAEPVLNVGRDCFIPAPKVDSEVIKLKLRKQPKVEVNNEKELFKLIKLNFTQRRKTLINVLVNSGMVKSKEVAMKIFDELEFDYGVRGETLNLEQYKLLIDCINKYSQY